MNSPQTIGRYEVLEELGRGAMGSVLKARDPAMDRTVAIKTILTTALESRQGEEYRERFQREARAAGALAHPGIVPVFDVGEHEGTPYLVMEYVEGRTLAAAMGGGERFTLERICELGQQMAEALGHAHKKGVIHRDIKPANILLTSAEAYGSERPRITDFGVAKLSAGQMTSTGQLLGTPAFMPPEQFTGSPVDGRADLFSLGVILYALSTGEQPFPGETVTTVSYKVVHTEPVPPGRLNRVLPPALDAAIMKCLAKSPADRYQTGEELAAALAAIRGLPASAMMRTAALGSKDDVDKTQDGSTPFRPMQAPVAVAVPAAAGRRSGGPAAWGLGGVAVLALVAGGWWFARHRTGAATTPEAQPVAVSDATSTPAGTAAPAPTAAVVPAESSSRAAADVPRARAAAAGVGFDPKTLDPKTNAKLKIELGKMPNGTPFTVEMGRRVYLNGVAGEKNTFENVFVPPGVQEFRVVMKAGGERKVSNTVSDEFKAKKRKTLKIELQGLEANGAPGRKTQVFVALK